MKIVDFNESTSKSKLGENKTGSHCAVSSLDLHPEMLSTASLMNGSIKLQLLVVTYDDVAKYMLVDSDTLGGQIINTESVMLLNGMAPQDMTHGKIKNDFIGPVVSNGGDT